MSPLQLGLIIAGVILVVGVLIYNGWVERRARRRRKTAPAQTEAATARAASSGGGQGQRVEPTLRSAATAATPAPQESAVQRASAAAGDDADSDFVAPMDVIAHDEEPEVPETEAPVALPPAGIAHSVDNGAGGQRQPDPDIECVVTLQPARAIGAGALAAGLHARLGKRLRWFGRSTPDASWQMLASETRGEFVEIAACMLLADRNGAASRAQLDTFVRVMGELAPLLPAAMSVPDAGAEADRAEALDRLCADVDVQVGLTVLKAEGAGIPGTKLRGVAEAAGFRLASGGRFEWVQEDTGAVHYTLQNLRNEPFTVDTLRISMTNGVVFVLDVPRVAEPVRAFDHMKLAAKRMAQTLGAELVDDNRRVLDDTALVAIRKQVDTAAAALRDCGIEPGSPRALALFGA
ncbi:MAG: cell division protein ZipA C-terminal FtsZ-binding domain-containing protein [Burkholderiales bacterium]|nr:cell division protein ZipA C-terminal FtsZ-binding domain-containing protein [Burkholderiales bacterium]